VCDGAGGRGGEAWPGREICRWENSQKARRSSLAGGWLQPNNLKGRKGGRGGGV